MANTAHRQFILVDKPLSIRNTWTQGESERATLKTEVLLHVKLGIFLHSSATVLQSSQAQSA